VVRLLPTPVASDDSGGRHPTRRPPHRREINLRDVATEFPTPTPTLVPSTQAAALAGRVPPTPAGNPNDGEHPGPWVARQARHPAPGINGDAAGIPLSVAIRLLPTPLAAEAAHGSPNQRSSSGQPGLTATVLRLLPTPRAGGNRNSRTALTTQRSAPGLEQAIEISLGIQPTELTGLTRQAPPSWQTHQRTRHTS